MGSIMRPVLTCCPGRLGSGVWQAAQAFASPAAALVRPHIEGPAALSGEAGEARVGGSLGRVVGEDRVPARITGPEGECSGRDEGERGARRRAGMRMVFSGSSAGRGGGLARRGEAAQPVQRGGNSDVGDDDGRRQLGRRLVQLLDRGECGRRPSRSRRRAP